MSSDILQAYIERSRRKLLDYIEIMWPIIEPSRRFISGFHIQAICEHLEALEKEDFRNLLINVPPGHMKSIACCVMYPSWVWIDKPQTRFLTASYAESLSIRDALKHRDIIKSDKFNRLYRPDWSLKDDQDQKKKFINTATGYRIATSVGGAGTGERADTIICDDPIKATEVSSEVIRQKASDWWFQTMATRDSDPKKTKRILIMQRLHEKDLAGEILSRGSDYEKLILPAEFEPKKVSYTKIWKDPRTKEGELLWPQQYGPSEIKQAKKDLGSFGYAGQFQQSPVPVEGGLFKRKWWKFYKERPAVAGQVVQFWDCAAKPGISNDYSSCATWLKIPTGYYLLDLWREKVEAPQLYRAIQMNFNKWSHLCQAIVIEDASAGTSAIQWLRQSTTLPVLAFSPHGQSKEIRASAATPTVESGNCFLPEGHTLIEDFIKEHESFPNGEHDDMVDTTSMMVNHFARLNISHPRMRQL